MEDSDEANREMFLERGFDIIDRMIEESQKKDHLSQFINLNIHN